MAGNFGGKRFRMPTLQQDNYFLLVDKGLHEAAAIKKYGIDKVGALNNFVRIEGHVSLKDMAGEEPPEHLPPEIEAVFKEGATCLAVGCFNAAATMFRLSVDLATKSLLPTEDGNGLNC
jgi:hypothetical protein